MDSWTLDDYMAANDTNFFGELKLTDQLIKERYYYAGGSFRLFRSGSKFAKGTVNRKYSELSNKKDLLQRGFEVNLFCWKVQNTSC
jgi:hypothetical protein